MKLKVFLSLLAACVLMAGVCRADDKLAPDFEGKLLSGDTFRIEDHIGKDVIVLNFFTTTCAPCRDEMPALDKFYAEHKKDGLALVGVDVVENPSLVKSFAAWMKISYPILLDGGALSSALRVNAYPTTVIIGVDGSIQYQAVNPIDVPVLLGAHLKVNQQLKKQDKAISKEDFVKKQGASLIKVDPPEIKPVAGSDKSAQKDEIFDIKVAHETPTEMDVDVDYYYSGDHGTQRVYIDCDPFTEKGESPFGMLPAIAQVGHFTAHAPLTAYDKTPPGVVSTKITCNLSSRLDSAQMATKTVKYEKTWSK